MDELLTAPSEIWQRAKSELQNCVTRDLYSSWFEQLELVGGDAEKLLLGAQGEFAAMWIRDNFIDILTKHVCLAAGRSMSVEVTASSTCISKKPDEEPKRAAGPADSRRAVSHPGKFAPPPSIKPCNTFETFVVGEGNRFAHAAALAVAQNVGTAFNPLFIYGATGLGKTHLMHAIAHFVMRNSPEKKITFISSEAFVNEYIDAVRDNKTLEFRRHYRSIDVLLIDDVQFFAGKERCQEEFFHTFNELFNAGKQIVLSCDKPINEVADIEQRLVSRFGWGVSVDIQAPDYETRLAILRKKMSALRGNVQISPEILEMLARRFTKNIRRMEGALTNLVAYASLVNASQPLPISKAQELLAEAFMQEDDNQVVDIQIIQKKVAEYYKIDEAEICGKRRTANIAMARQVAMFISRRLTTHSLQEIGKQFGNRDHGTVMHAMNVVDTAMKNSDNFKRSVEYLLNALSL